MTQLDDYFLVNQAAEVLGVSANTVRSWAASGKLQEYRHPVNNYRLFKNDNLETLLSQIQNPQPAQRSDRKAK